MKITKKMDIEMEAIWLARKDSDSKVLNKSEVERITAKLTENGKPISRESIYKSKNPIWMDLRKAIEGNLPANHPIEIRISSYGSADKSGLFAERMQKLEVENEELKIFLGAEKSKYEELQALVYDQQYLNSDSQVNFDKRETELNNLIKNESANVKVIQNYQAENRVLNIEIEKYRKAVNGMADSFTGAKYSLIQPDVSKLVIDAGDKELFVSYQTAITDMYEGICNKWEKRPPNDIIFIFHAFNAEMNEFVRDEVLLRFVDGNCVVACFVYSATIRCEMYRRAAAAITPLFPQVYLVDGGTMKPSDLQRQSKVVNIKGRSFPDQLWALTAKYKPDYNVIMEGYHSVRIIRGTLEGQ